MKLPALNSNISTDTDNGSISINESVLISIIKDAAEQVPGVIRLTSTGSFAETMAYMIGRTKSKPDSVTIKWASKELFVSVKIIISYGINVHDLGHKVQMAIAQSIKTMAQIEPSAIDVYIENVEGEETNQKLYEFIEPIV